MRSTLHATTLLTASWFVTLFVGLVSSKVLAVVLDPAGFGYYGLLQNFVELVAMAAGLGMGVALVRSGANLLAMGDEIGLAGLRHGAWLIFGATGLASVSVLVVFRTTLSGWFLGGGDHRWAVLSIAIAVPFSVASYIQINTLNAYHRIKALALCNVWGKILGVVLVILPLLIWGREAVAAAVILGAIGGWLASSKYLKGEMGAAKVRVPLRDAIAGARTLLKIGVPYIGSVALSKGASLVLPILVAHMLGMEGVGYYRAAAAVALTYLGFLVTAMGQDYFPRISAVSHNVDVLCQVVNEQQRLVLLLAVPMILGMLALVPYLIPLAYSPKFLPAVDLLEWQLIGDIFRLSSLTMSIVILARCGGKALLFTEALLAVSTLGTSWLGIHWFGLPGLGIAFLISYVIYYVAAWVIVRRETGLRFSRANKQYMWAAISASLLVRLLPYTPLTGFRTPIALALAVVSGVWSLAVLSREVGEIQHIAPFQRALLRMIARIKTVIPIALERNR